MSFIVYHTPHNGKLSAVIPHAKAVEIKAALKDSTGLTAAQLEYIENIKGMYLGSEKPQPERIEDKLTNPGILQGMNEAIPRGDR